MRAVSFLAAAVAVTALAGCKQEELTAAEARDAVEESSISSQASALTSNSVELSTSFTIGKGVKEAASELRSFIETQLPCAEVTASEGTLAIEYGKRGGQCTYRGNAYSGKHTVTIARNEDAQVLVNHVWTDVSNGKVKVSGTAKVTWDLDDKYRQVEHDLTWTRLSDGRTGRGTGTRKQTPLANGLGEGFQVDGERTWTGRNGTWETSIESVQWRWQDPVPQAGRYVISTPKGKTISLSFSRLDEDTVEVKIEGAKRDFSFKVTREGSVDDA